MAPIAIDTNGSPKAFTRPPIRLDRIPPQDGDAKTVVELVDYHARVNPQYTYCRQARRPQPGSGIEFIDVNYTTLKRAVLSCQKWLQDTILDLELPKRNDNGDVVKGAPVALFMDSNVGHNIYMFALLGLGVPAIVLSPRLAPPAAKHILEKTHACAVLVSPRLQVVADEIISLFNANGSKPNGTVNGNASQFHENPTPPTQYNPAPYEEFLNSTKNSIDMKSDICGPLTYVSEDDRNVLILHSSGTTGLPKPIYASHRHYLGFTQCHAFASDEQMQSPTLATLPMFHAFGLLPVHLSLGIGKIFCLPVSGEIPRGSSTIQLLRCSGAKSLITVPSILEDIASMPTDEGIKILQALEFVAFGGATPKETAGHKLTAAGVKLLNQYGATETGPIAPFCIPPPHCDWHYFRLRKDTEDVLQMQLQQVGGNEADTRWQLSLEPFGWTERFHIQDFLVKRPGSDEEFAVIGRSDDIIVLATGEKVRPAILESMLGRNENIKAAVAFGEKQFEIGLIIEPIRPIIANEHESFKSSIWPLIEKANAEMDAHAQVSSPRAVIIVQPDSLPRSDKGTVARRKVYEQFADQIAAVYRQLDGAADFLPSLRVASLEQDIRKMMRENLPWKIADSDWNDDKDFFELGMDSLQATQLRRLLAASVLQGKDGVRTSLTHIDREFVYQHSSIAKLARTLRGGEIDGSNGLISEPASSHSTLEDLINAFRIQPSKPRRATANVLLTGGTGSLGAHLLTHLANDPNVGRIFCINRPSAQDPYARQAQAVKSKSLTIPEAGWSKIRVFEADTSSSHLGLELEDYINLRGDVTHIIHNAFPMSFKMQLSSFEAQFRVLQNLLVLSRDAQANRPLLKPRVLFVSSISTVGRYSSVHDEIIVPEVPMRNYDSSVHIGYGQAKLVCEQIIERTRQDFSDIEAGYVRVGQIAGSQKGFWNTDEHIAALVASSQKVGKLPMVQGTHSWLPVDVAATAMSDILLSPEPMQLVYHLENPIRQSWHETLDVMASGLKLGKDSLVPFKDWLAAISSAPDEGNPAKVLADFFREDFERISGGSFILSTDQSRKCSAALRKLGPVGKETIYRYIDHWRGAGIIV